MNEWMNEWMNKWMYHKSTYQNSNIGAENYEFKKEKHFMIIHTKILCIPIEVRVNKVFAIKSNMFP